VGSEQLALLGPGRVQARDRSCVPFRPRKDVLARFAGKVVRTETCWWWVGAVSQGGYGAFAETHDAVIGAHRWALEVALGRRLWGDEVASHGCDEPLCVRVGEGHIRLASQAENIEEMRARGRRVGRWALDGRSRADRSREIRAAVRAADQAGTDPVAAAAQAAAAATRRLRRSSAASDPGERHLRLPLT